jgi:hypothetical protein
VRGICRDYEGVSKSFRTGRLERELQMVQLSATRCSCIAILWVSLVSCAAINLCIASQWVFVVMLRLSPETFGYTLVLTYLLTYLLTYSLTHSLTHSMVQDILWKAGSHSARQTTTCFLYGTRRSINVLTTARHWTLSWASRIQFVP